MEFILNWLLTWYSLEKHWDLQSNLFKPTLEGFQACDGLSISNIDNQWSLPQVKLQILIITSQDENFLHLLEWGEI